MQSSLRARLLCGVDHHGIADPLVASGTSNARTGGACHCGCMGLTWVSLWGRHEGGVIVAIGVHHGRLTGGDDLVSGDHVCGWRWLGRVGKRSRSVWLLWGGVTTTRSRGRSGRYG